MPVKRSKPLPVSCRGLLTLALLAATACSQTDTGQTPNTAATGQKPGQQPAPFEADLPARAQPFGTETATPASQEGLYPQVLIRTSAGDITVKLDAHNAPITVDNFLNNYLARGFYAGTIFHYVEPGKTAMAGGYTPDAELKETRAAIANEADNGLKNQRGTMAMARSPDHAHSATSQFFFNLADNPGFDHVGRETPDDFGYCVFGEVVSGMEVLDQIGQLEVHETPISSSCPKDPPVIHSVEQLQ